MSGVPVIIVFRINKAGMEKMKKIGKGNEKVTPHIYEVRLVTE